MDLFCYLCLFLSTVVSVPCTLVVTCWERTDLLTLLYVMFSCVFFAIFPCSVLDQVWCSIVSFPDLWFLPHLLVELEIYSEVHLTDVNPLVVIL